MATKQKKRGKRPVKNANGVPPSLRAQKNRLERELKTLREENKWLKKHLGALIFKDDPVNMDLSPEDGVTEPSLDQLIKELDRTGK